MGVGQMHETREFVPCGVRPHQAWSVDQRLAQPDERAGRRRRDPIQVDLGVEPAAG